MRSLIERYTLKSTPIWSLASLVKLHCIVDMIIDSICFKSLRIRLDSIIH